MMDVPQSYTYSDSHRYSLPSRISEHVDLIKPAVALSPPVKRTSLDRRDFAGGLAQLTSQVVHIDPEGGQIPSNSTTHSISTVPQSCKRQVSRIPSCDVLIVHHPGENTITPTCLRAFYQIPRANSTTDHSELGVFEAGGAYAQADLDEYFATFAPYVPQGTHPYLASINGAQAPVAQSVSQGESVIDLDLMFSLSFPQPVTLYQVLPSTKSSGSNHDTFLSAFLEAIDGSFCTGLDRSSGHECGIYNLTKVVSVSYVALELGYSEASQRRACHEIAKLGLRGHTVVFASGDYGVAGFPDPATDYNGCVTADLQANGPDSGSIFNPTFPSNCPFVLSVGATQLRANETTQPRESVMHIDDGSRTFSSSGGFSNFFARPAYQETVVERYLSSFAPSLPWYSLESGARTGSAKIGGGGGVYNRAGRGFPDVSAIGASLGTFIQGHRTQALGTSLAAPIWASILAMINAERASLRKSAIGFVNPALYQHPEVFNDITAGNNAGCGTAGFSAAPGWDPATGLGSPNYPALRELFLRLP